VFLSNKVGSALMALCHSDQTSELCFNLVDIARCASRIALEVVDTLVRGEGQTELREILLVAINEDHVIVEDFH
jgi:hypothetical protein